MEQWERLRAAIEASGLLEGIDVDEGIVSGSARLPAAGVEVIVEVDPDIDETPEADEGALVAAAERILRLPEAQWRRIVESIAAEIDEAIGGEEVLEPTDLCDDLAIRSVVVLPDAILLSFAAPRQFPDSWIRAQLDDDLSVDEVVIDEKDE